jgi:hypothetical protein
VAILSRKRTSGVCCYISWCAGNGFAIPRAAGSRHRVSSARRGRRGAGDATDRHVTVDREPWIIRHALTTAVIGAVATASEAGQDAFDEIAEDGGPKVAGSTTCLRKRRP